MKKFAKLHTFLVGASVGMGIVSLVLLVLVLSGNVPWLKAASVGSGAPDINAGYLDGYETSLSAAASKIYISDVSNYLPDNTVDSGAIVNETIVSADIDDGTITSGDLADGACLAEILDDDGIGSGLDADLLIGIPVIINSEDASPCIQKTSGTANGAGAKALCISEFGAQSSVANCGATASSCSGLTTSYYFAAEGSDSGLVIMADAGDGVDCDGSNAYCDGGADCNNWTSASSGVTGRYTGSSSCDYHWYYAMQLL